ncbi:MAG TPA: TraR/DksA C4-type zinc finger protein [Bacillota bacterium]|nr:yteA family sporulation protein [Bacillota bacterium]HOB87029.1 TraR/DksA C4-type zinc finger protein [Bacillota bacterium]HOP69133.1 TraR/DksA C4-type zinc finger protein [Bacillota bacterium]HPT33811.1 TraR/DksA C4-type zinc finger protein [Bacillota bacterium]HPZ64312.1 TraR/DksA C4-type zinc finger protein [Bacillota bacterium]
MAWEQQERALRAKRRELLRRLESGDRSERRSLRDMVGELSLADNHPADLASENFERSKEISLQEQSYNRLRQVEEALKRIEEGTYGICRRCGADIGRERLEALPEALLCHACREHEEREAVDRSPRPQEEGGLLPPFARRNVAGDPGFDEEDFWQEAARHNKRPNIYEDMLEDENTGLVEGIDSLTGADYREQLED